MPTDFSAGGKINAVAADLTADAAPSVDDGERAQGLHRACAELMELLTSVRQITIRNPVRQASMTTGDVELF